MKRSWTSEELLEHFTLLPAELMAVSNKSGATRLGFAVLLKCLQYEGRFLRSRQREFHRTDEEALLDWLCTEVFDHEQHPGAPDA